MRRLHIVELEDLPWFSRVIRDGATTYLAWISARSGQIELLVPTLERLLRRTGELEIVDLCSGGAGPMPGVVAGLRARVAGSRDLDRLLPERRSARARVRGLGWRTESFERVDRRDARARRAPRGTHDLERLPSLPPGASAPDSRGRRARAPADRGLRDPDASAAWDGIASWLRIYSESELRELVTPFAGEAYDWEIGKIRLGRLPVHASYLLGAPRAASPAHPLS